jgi:MFS family permease
VALSSLQPLRRKNFALIWSAALVSNVGSWMQTVAVGALVTEGTGKSVWTGIVAAAAFIPIGIFAPIGGALADRVDRRRYFIGTTIGETFFATLLAVVVATGNHEPWLVTLIVFCGGVLTALGFPAYQAIIPELVPKEELLAAMSLGAAQYNLGRVVGPALAGVAVAVGSYQLAFTINAASFGAVIVALLLSHFAERPHTPEQTRLRAQIVAGFRGAMAEPGCRLAIALIGITALLISPFIALIPAMAINVLHDGVSGTSILVTAQGVGAVLGALALTPLANRYGRRQVIIGDLCVVLPATIVLYYLAPSLWTAAVALVAVGAAYIGVLSGLMTVVQLRAAENLRARILSLYMVSLGVVYPIGAVIEGRLGDSFGLPAVAIGAAIVFAVVVSLVLGTRAQRRAVLEEARTAGAELQPAAVGSVLA